MIAKCNHSVFSRRPSVNPRIPRPASTRPAQHARLNTPASTRPTLVARPASRTNPTRPRSRLAAPEHPTHLAFGRSRLRHTPSSVTPVTFVFLEYCRDP
jgi:hypothetical protein